MKAEEENKTFFQGLKDDIKHIWFNFKIVFIVGFLFLLVYLLLYYIGGTILPEHSGVVE